MTVDLKPKRRTNLKTTLSFHHHHHHHYYYYYYYYYYCYYYYLLSIIYYLFYLFYLFQLFSQTLLAKSLNLDAAGEWSESAIKIVSDESRIACNGIRQVSRRAAPFEAGEWREIQLAPQHSLPMGYELKNPVIAWVLAVCWYAKYQPKHQPRDLSDSHKATHAAPPDRQCSPMDGFRGALVAPTMKMLPNSWFGRDQA